MENLLKPENKAQLVKILTYHVLPGKVLSTDVARQVIDVKTVQGQTLHVSGGYVITLNGVSTVVLADIITDNGVIHVIDTVLLPK